MDDKDLETKENRIHRIFSKMAFQIGFGAFFLGLGVQSTSIHAAQIAHYDHGNSLYIVMLIDSGFFLVGAAAITKGIKSLGKAMMLIADLNPDWQKN